MRVLADGRRASQLGWFLELTEGHAHLLCVSYGGALLGSALLACAACIGVGWLIGMAFGLAAPHALLVAMALALDAGGPPGSRGVHGGLGHVACLLDVPAHPRA